MARSTAPISAAVKIFISPDYNQPILVPNSVRELFRTKILRPLLRQLRGGVTTRRLAWSLAVGVIIGINPSVGITTFVVILLAWIFGLSKVASMVGAHAVAPLHLLLFLPFIELGVHIFHTHRLPMDRRQLERLSHHPLRLVRDIWQWEWHALIVWGIIAALAVPILAKYLRRGLVVLMRRNRALLYTTPPPHDPSKEAVGAPGHLAAHRSDLGYVPTPSPQTQHQSTPSPPDHAPSHFP